MRVTRLVLFYAVCTLALPLTSVAAVQLPNLFSDHAVVQRDRPVRIWGWARAGEMVTVRFHGQTVTAETDGFGNWEAWLKPEPAGGPYTLAVSSNMSSRPVERKDILVWRCVARFRAVEHGVSSCRFHGDNSCAAQGRGEGDSRS